jgi:excisionase family DNA binding protein
MPTREFLSTRQAAVRLGVSLGTVQNMVESGALDAWKTAGGHRRIPATAVDALLARRQKQNAGSGMPHLDILIAEDDVQLQKLYRATVDSWKLPITLRVVADGFEALLQVGQRRPDILIADLLMPSMDGYELIRRLHGNESLAEMEIVVVSAIPKAEIESGGLPGNITVFSKPVPFHEIKGFLLACLAARQRQIQN